MTTRETVRALRASDEDEWGEIVESAIEAATGALRAEDRQLREAVQTALRRLEAGRRRGWLVDDCGAVAVLRACLGLAAPLEETS